jgi:DNA-binding NarL/FixJ family response regulator
MDPNDHNRLDILVMHAEPLVAVGLAAALRQQVGFGVHVDGVDDIGIGIDVVITDYQSGLKLARSGLNRPAPLKGARVLVMTTNDREHDVRLALEAGVHGYLLLGCAIDELAASVRTLGAGSRYLCMAVAQRMADSLTRESLTAREAEVLHLLVRGHCNKMIGRQLEIAVGTVKAHVKAIMGKLGASSRTQAASIAAQRGLGDGPMPGVAPTRRPLGSLRSNAGSGYERAQYA